MLLLFLSGFPRPASAICTHCTPDGLWGAHGLSYAARQWGGASATGPCGMILSARGTTDPGRRAASYLSLASDTAQAGRKGE